MPEGESIKDVSERSIKAFDKICLSQKENDLSLLVLMMQLIKPSFAIFSGLIIQIFG